MDVYSNIYWMNKFIRAFAGSTVGVYGLYSIYSSKDQLAEKESQGKFIRFSKFLVNLAIIESLKTFDTKGKSEEEIKTRICKPLLETKIVSFLFIKKKCEKCFNQYYEEFLSKGKLPPKK